MSVSLLILSIEEGRRPPPVANPASRAEGVAFCRKVRRDESGMMMLGDIAAARVCLAFVCKRLAAWHHAI